MHRLAMTGFWSVVSAAVCAAQSSNVVTEAEFLSALNETHPAVSESLAEVNTARARTVAAATRENPELGFVHEDLSGPSSLSEWSLSWQLPSVDRRLAISASRAADGAASARHQERLLDLRLQMKAVYAEWALAQARHRRLALRFAQVEALAQRETRRAQSGESSGLEAQRLVLAASALAIRVELAAAASDQARAYATRWVPSLPRQAQPTLPPLPPMPSAPSSAVASEEHPRLLAARQDLDSARLQSQAARRFVRSPEVVLGWQREELGSRSDGGPVLGLTWSVPLFGRQQAEQAAAQARLSQASARLEIARRQLAAKRTGALAAFQRLHLALANAEAAHLQNERMLDGAEASFRHGEASVTDLLDIYDSVTEAELAVLELRQAVMASHRDLERALGIDDVDSDSLEDSP